MSALHRPSTPPSALLQDTSARSLKVKPASSDERSEHDSETIQRFMSQARQKHATPLESLPKHLNANEGDDFESPYTEQFMSQARKKFAVHPERLSLVDLADIDNTSDLDDTLDAALERSMKLSEEAKAQLDAPCISDPELTDEEIVELVREKQWDHTYAKANALNDAWEKRNDEIFVAITALIDGRVSKGLAIPQDLQLPVSGTAPALEQMGVPKEVASWIMESKKSLPSRPTEPLKADRAVAALKKIQATDEAAQTCRVRKNIATEGSSDSSEPEIAGW